MDGWPYLVGLTSAAVVFVSAALALAASGRVVAGAVCGIIGVAAAVPAALGSRYVVSGKLWHRDRLLDLVPWRGDEMVLDVGAGAGLLGIGAAKRVPHGRVHCLDLWVGKDLTGNGPERLRRNAALEGVAARIEVVTGDARALGLPDASVDVVVSALCLHNIPDEAGRHAATREIARVLRPGGHVAISDLAGTNELAAWLTSEGLTVVTHDKAPATFPPQRLLLARRALP